MATGRWRPFPAVEIDLASVRAGFTGASGWSLIFGRILFSANVGGVRVKPEAELAVQVMCPMCCTSIMNNHTQTHADTLASSLWVVNWVVWIERYSISETVNLSVCAASALSLQLITGKVLLDKLYEHKKTHTYHSAPYASWGGKETNTQTHRQAEQFSCWGSVVTTARRLVVFYVTCRAWCACEGAQIASMCQWNQAGSSRRKCNRSTCICTLSVACTLAVNIYIHTHITQNKTKHVRKVVLSSYYKGLLETKNNETKKNEEDEQTTKH